MQRAKGTERLLEVLDCVIDQDQPMTRNAIAAAINAPRSTIYSIIEVMLAHDYLEQIEPEGLIVPGPKCGLMGLAYDRHATLGRKARQVVSRLARKAGEVAELDVMRGWRQMVQISETGRGHNYRVASEGSTSPLPQTASGRFLLDGVSREDMKKNFAADDYVMADGSVLSLDELCQHIERARRQGYWVASGLIDPYIACIASPVRDREERCIGAICLVVPLPEMTHRSEEFIAMTREAAEELTQLLRATSRFADMGR
jgi:DNA-binding IclR family transcriptional regulator